MWVDRRGVGPAERVAAYDSAVGQAKSELKAMVVANISLFEGFLVLFEDVLRRLVDPSRLSKQGMRSTTPGSGVSVSLRCRLCLSTSPNRVSRPENFARVRSRPQPRPPADALK